MRQIKTEIKIKIKIKIENPGRRALRGLYA